MIAVIITIGACSVLLFGAIVLLVMNQFKDEPPTWSSYLSEKGLKFWKRNERV